MITHCAIIESKNENIQNNMGIVLYHRREDALSAVRNLNNTSINNDDSVKIELTM